MEYGGIVPGYNGMYLYVCILLYGVHLVFLEGTVLCAYSMWIVFFFGRAGRLVVHCVASFFFFEGDTFS